MQTRTARALTAEDFLVLEFLSLQLMRSLASEFSMRIGATVFSFLPMIAHEAIEGVAIETGEIRRRFAFEHRKLRLAFERQTFTDIVAFHRQIQHTTLERSLRERVGDAWWIDLLMDYLSEYAAVPQHARGIPEDLMAATIIGNAFLFDVDDALVENDVEFLRLYDEYYLFASNGRQESRAFEVLRNQLVHVGLDINESKTRRHRGDSDEPGAVLWDGLRLAKIALDDDVQATSAARDAEAPRDAPRVAAGLLEQSSSSLSLPSSFGLSLSAQAPSTLSPVSLLSLPLGISLSLPESSLAFPASESLPESPIPATTEERASKSVDTRREQSEHYEHALEKATGLVGRISELRAVSERIRHANETDRAACDRFLRVLIVALCKGRVVGLESTASNDEINTLDGTLMELSLETLSSAARQSLLSYIFNVFARRAGLASREWLHAALLLARSGTVRLYDMAHYLRNTILLRRPADEELTRALVDGFFSMLDSQGTSDFDCRLCVSLLQFALNKDARLDESYKGRLLSFAWRMARARDNDWRTAEMAWTVIANAHGHDREFLQRAVTELRRIPSVAPHGARILHEAQNALQHHPAAPELRGELVRLGSRLESSDATWIAHQIGEHDQKRLRDWAAADASSTYLRSLGAIPIDCAVRSGIEALGLGSIPNSLTFRAAVVSEEATDVSEAAYWRCAELLRLAARARHADEMALVNLVSSSIECLLRFSLELAYPELQRLTRSVAELSQMQVVLKGWQPRKTLQKHLEQIMQVRNRNPLSHAWNKKRRELNPNPTVRDLESFDSAAARMFCGIYEALTDGESVPTDEMKKVLESALKRG